MKTITIIKLDIDTTTIFTNTIFKTIDNKNNEKTYKMDLWRYLDFKKDLLNKGYKIIEN